MDKEFIENIMKQELSLADHIEIFFRRLWSVIKKPFTLLKWSFQRATKGYCDYDLYDLDYWFCSIMPRMLREFSDRTHTYPNEMTYEEWQTTVKKMADYFEKANLNFSDFILASESESNLAKENIHEGLKLFEKHFYDLWD